MIAEYNIVLPANYTSTVRKVYTVKRIRVEAWHVLCIDVFDGKIKRAEFIYIWYFQFVKQTTIV
jgi:hypothetical protein